MSRIATTNNCCMSTWKSWDFNPTRLSSFNCTRLLIFEEHPCGTFTWRRHWQKLIFSFLDKVLEERVCGEWTWEKVWGEEFGGIRKNSGLCLREDVRCIGLDVNHCCWRWFNSSLIMVNNGWMVMLKVVNGDHKYIWVFECLRGLWWMYLFLRVYCFHYWRLLYLQLG